MKVLVDSCIWSLALRRNRDAALSHEEEFAKAQLRRIIEDGRVAMIGPIRQELLSGLRDEGQFERLRNSLSPFEDELLVREDYEQAARFYNLCRSQGVISAPVDILICAVGYLRKWTVFTNDQGLLRCQAVLRSAGLAL